MIVISTPPVTLSWFLSWVVCYLLYLLLVVCFSFRWMPEPPPSLSHATLPPYSQSCLKRSSQDLEIPGEKMSLHFPYLFGPTKGQRIKRQQICSYSNTYQNRNVSHFSIKINLYVGFRVNKIQQNPGNQASIVANFSGPLIARNLRTKCSGFVGPWGVPSGYMFFRILANSYSILG